LTFGSLQNRSGKGSHLQHISHQQVAPRGFVKKSVAKAGGLSYFHTQLHRRVPGQSEMPRGASGAKQEKH
jgi:hypothetical protein